ncbi:PP2C family protein-serine/threonine phosphatase [Streptomyces gibsoniae]|uniref:PP2C family protein-serine/threonine phosphatase n=1 Tax=Streptomyces gibsoniae TaxID=3075529 RepID=A0ABU2TZ05_9ACTN|nr:PP2C family protein-serine/threonine phosphatase [Streptomyces sp. DSM 41699]MDT0466205.1 PP2C family protein-serine/threonine phosphatase [Streptomyces sp. DSM 41699]
MLPVVLLILVGIVSLVAPSPLDIGFLLGAIPPLAVLSYGPAATATLGLLVVGLQHTRVFHLDRPGSTDLLTISFVAVLSVFVSYVRSHRDAQLNVERTVAEAAQNALVPPLREQVGPVHCTGLYRAAQRGTLVGGDFFDVREGPTGVRAVMGDVQGHGLSAVSTVASLLGAFREAVLDQPDLPSVASRLDRRLLVDSGNCRLAELFATVVLLEFSPDARTVRIIACGSPAPVLLHDGKATELEVSSGTPLGIGLSEGGRYDEVVRTLEGGDRLFLASDGIWEARNASGAFYPLIDRLPRFAEDEPAETTERVWEDLLSFCGSVRDDATMLLLTPEPRGDP